MHKACVYKELQLTRTLGFDHVVTGTCVAYAMALIIGEDDTLLALAGTLLT